MSERIPQSVTKRVPLLAFLSSDHVTPATGKTIAITISKNGAAFGNPSGGATNATEIASGWYYVDLSTTDTGTTGPLIVLGTASGVDNVTIAYTVADAHNAGFDGVPSVAAGSSGGLATVDSNNAVKVQSGTGANQISLSSGKVSLVSGDMTTIAGDVWDVTLSGHVTAGSTGAALNAAGSAGDPWITSLPGSYTAGQAGYILGHNLDAQVSTRLATSGYTAPDNADIAAIKAKTDNLPAAPAAVGDIPTATQNADALLKRDWTAITGEAARSVLNALRFLRNKVDATTSPMRIYKEDDSTQAWTQSFTTSAGADPIIKVG